MMQLFKKRLVLDCQEIWRFMCIIMLCNEFIYKTIFSRDRIATALLYYKFNQNHHHGLSCLKDEIIISQKAMPGQKKISSFFMTTSKKRAVLSTIENEEPNSKLRKEDQHIITKTKSSVASQKTLVPSSDKKSMQNSWRNALRNELQKPYYLKLNDFVKQERLTHTVYPPEDQVFSWMQHCDIHDVKVVILGQDPYHGPRQAHGLCFSVQKGIPPPPSLVNIYKELENDVEGFKHPGHGDLTGWADQGVLLLNAVLTVSASKANSHKDKGWEQFTDAVITWLNSNLTGIVFLLWGSYAQKKGAKINTKRHHVLKSVHPSPLSAYRGFFGCKHFSKTNEILEQQGKVPIDWKAL